MAAYRLENCIRFCARPCIRLQDSGNSTIVQQQICRRKPKDDFESTSTQVQIAWVQLELIPIKVPKMIQQQHRSSSGSKKSGKLGSAQALPCFVICSWEWKTEFMDYRNLILKGRNQVFWSSVGYTQAKKQDVALNRLESNPILLRKVGETALYGQKWSWKCFSNEITLYSESPMP